MARLWNLPSSKYSGWENEGIVERTLREEEKDAENGAYQKAGRIWGEATGF